jgi:hypothetical protein
MRLKRFLMLLRLWKSSSLESVLSRWTCVCVRMHDTTQMTSHGILYVCTQTNSCDEKKVWLSSSTKTTIPTTTTINVWHFFADYWFIYIKNEVRQFQNLIFLRISVVEEQCAEYTPFVWVVRYSSQIFLIINLCLHAIC